MIFYNNHFWVLDAMDVCFNKFKIYMTINYTKGNVFLKHFFFKVECSVLY